MIKDMSHAYFFYVSSILNTIEPCPFNLEVHQCSWGLRQIMLRVTKIKLAMNEPEQNK